MNALPYLCSALLLTVSIAAAQAQSTGRSEVVSASSILPDVTHSDTANQTIVIQTGNDAIAELILDLSTAVQPPKAVQVIDPTGQLIAAQVQINPSSISIQFTPPIAAKSQIAIELQQVQQSLWSSSVFYNLTERAVGQTQRFSIGMIELKTYRSPASD